MAVVKSNLILVDLNFTNENVIFVESNVQIWPALRNVWMAKLEDNLRNFENYGDDEESNWPPKKIINTDGAVFFIEALMTKTGFYCWANYLGSSDDAKNFAIEFHTGNKSAMSRRNAQDESFNYTGPVHTLDE